MEVDFSFVHRRGMAASKDAQFLPVAPAGWKLKSSLRGQFSISTCYRIPALQLQNTSFCQLIDGATTYINEGEGVSARTVVRVVVI